MVLPLLMPFGIEIQDDIVVAINIVRQVAQKANGENDLFCI